jgi:hypothetical protein
MRVLCTDQSRSVRVRARASSPTGPRTASSGSTEPIGPTFSPAASRMAASEYATTTSSACRGSCLSGRRSRFDDMRGVPTSQWRRLVIVFGCAALVVLLAFAKPATAQGKPSSRDRVPSELWKTYPLEPSEEGARIRSSPESDQPQVSPPSSGNVPAGRDDGQPSAVGDDSSDPLALSVFFLSLVGLLVGGLALPALVVRVLEIGKKPAPQTGRAPPTHKRWRVPRSPRPHQRH